MRITTPAWLLSERIPFVKEIINKLMANIGFYPAQGKITRSYGCSDEKIEIIITEIRRQIKGNKS